MIEDEQMKRLVEMKEELNKCVKCGTCRAICPTFRILGVESASARGKMTLIDAYLKGEITHSDAYLRHLKECTMCGACKDTCPSGVNTTGLIMAARAEVIEKQGMSFAASFVMKSLLDPGKLIPVALKFASRLQGLIMKDASASSGLIARFSMPMPTLGGRLIPALAKTFFLDMPEVRRLDRAGKLQDGVLDAKKVAFYAGCGVNYLMPEVGLASIDVLKRAGAQVTVPGAQVCCGMPAFSMGDVTTAKAMALKNLEIFESGDYDYIATSCATCGQGLKGLFKKLLGNDPKLAARVDDFSKKVRDITELLVNDLRYKPDGSGKDNAGVTVTYHDPCHLNRAQNIRRQPRELIAGAKGVTFKEMKHPCSCCGLGGGLSTSNYELSIEIARRKAESVRDTGADVLVTACPGCIVQLRDALHQYGVKAKVAHVVELL